MTAYFDDLNREVREASQRCPSDEAFLAELGEVERRVLRDVSLCCGDREFPDAFRERILGACAVLATVGPLADHLYEKARERARVGRDSPLLDRLHSLFHEVARERIQTRFGWLSDSPAGNVKRRDEHDAEKAKELGL